MRINSLKAIVKAAVLLFGAGAASAQVSVNLTAGPATATLPDGSAVPMWGYSCATGSTNCAPLNPAATNAATWSPVVITVPTGQSLTISLTNSLSFTPAGSTIPNTVPTSLVIVGQVGGGLGNVAQRTTTASPDHSNAQTNVEWPIAGSSDNPGMPPAQGPRVQSFSTEVVAGSAGPGQCASPCALPPWTAPRPGTYLLESGTHPSIQGPMGLYGIVVVTTAPTSAAGLP